MSTVFRIGSAEASRSAYGRIEMLNPIKQKARVKLLREHCALPIVSNKGKFGQTHILSTPKAVASLYGSHSSVRWSHLHTDVKFPDFTSYRIEVGKDPTRRTIETEDTRKVLPYFAYGVGSIVGLYVSKQCILTVVAYKSPPRSMLALATIEVNLNDIPAGKSATFLWQGKPVFVRHRTKEQIEAERAVNIAELRDPQTDAQRTKKEEWLVVIGVCTHLGCVPLSNLGNYGGYYCPCHGSHYDLSGRIRDGPAPLNLEIPKSYEFVGDDKLLIG